GELTAIIPDLGDPKFEYARADKATAWMILAKLYLNAETYIGQPKYTEAIEILENVLNGPDAIAHNYRHNFVADNHPSPEMIFPIAFDGINTQSFGGMVYVLLSQVGQTMPAYELFGVNERWAGLRTTSALVEKFDDGDSRALFWSEGHSLEINDIGVFTDGYGVTKFRNRKLDGS